MKANPIGLHTIGDLKDVTGHPGIRMIFRFCCASPKGMTMFINSLSGLILTGLYSLQKMYRLIPWVFN
ncbi:hypothetical protein [Paraflavitalea speifideaquila]|uniref:hypothetical protein n=1 Tax=Paraflavitalea speifideaquila TaxID=3076558 RepID=UPI0028F01C5D|nr:hypothetical protein [Paraflavitalea speifideiaquila]